MIENGFMPTEESVALLKQGVDVWNAWRQENTLVQVDLRGAKLCCLNLSGALLYEVNFHEADLGGSNLSYAHLIRANLEGANLRVANLEGADLEGANLIYTDLRRADLRGTILAWANLRRANLLGANLDLAKVEGTLFSDLDLRNVHGLETLRHYGPSTVGIDTIYRSAGQISESFLRGCGVPNALIEYLPSLIAAMQPIQYYSCFISYSTIDEAFTRRLYDRMRGDHLQVWFAPEELKAGEKLFDQIDQAIRVYDKLVLVLSEASMSSSWVQIELRRALTQERRGGNRKLFPIRVVPMESLQDWTLFDADAGTDLAAEVRSYYIPDFSNWKDHDAFEEAYARLLRDLKAAA